MEALLAILRINDTIVYSVYGQVFFSLGLVVALSSRRHSQLDLARQLAWLAAFGLSHGLYEWAHVFIPIQQAYLPDEAIDLLVAARAILLPLSFLFLGQFGCLLVFPEGRLRSGARALFALLFVAWATWALLSTNVLDSRALPASAWARRLLGLPASAVAAIGMFRQARVMEKGGLRNIAGDFRIAGVSFAAYGFLAGFVIGSVPDPQTAGWPIYDLTLRLLGLPAPVLRSVAGLGMAFGIVRGLRIFEIETDRLLEAAERARLKAAEQARSAMESMATTISSNHDLSTLLPSALKEVKSIVAAEAGWLALRDGKTGSIEIIASLGLRKGHNAPALPCHPDGCRCLAASILDGATTFQPKDHCGLWPGEEAGRVLTAVPLAAQGRLVGTIHLFGGDLNQEKLGLLTSIGRQLGLAIENAWLETEVARKEAARAHLLRQAITAQEEERRRVARELHDQTGQSLIAVIMALGAAREQLEGGPPKLAAMVEDAREIAVQALESTREMILGLRPAALDDLGLVPALRRFSEDLARKHGVHIHLDSDGLPRRLPSDVEVVLFRVLQESLHNVVRHSRARTARVHLSYSDDVVVEAEVSDDGIGFNPMEATSNPKGGRGLGLLGMTERVGLVGGKVTIDTAPGRGTRVLVNIPLPAVV